MITRLKLLALLIGAVVIGAVAAFTMSIASYEPPQAPTPMAAPASTYEDPRSLAAEANLRLQEDVSAVGEATPSPSARPSRQQVQPSSTEPVSTYVDTPYVQTPVPARRQEPGQPAPPAQAAQPAQAVQETPTATSPEPVYPAAVDPTPAAMTAVDTVTPGAWCARASAGTTGYSKSGILMTCTYADGEDVPRWRA